MTVGFDKSVEPLILIYGIEKQVIDNEVAVRLLGDTKATVFKVRL